MNCADLRLLSHAYLDDELDAADSLGVARHISECPACAQRLRLQAQLRERLRDAGLYRSASAALRTRIAARLPRPAHERRHSRRGWSVALATLAALCVIAVMFAGWQALQLRRQGSDALIADAVSDHVPSLLPGHLIDVRSTNEHTVKPWFDGRVDFSPQVRDLTAQGFELVGGRLDVLDGKQVAALVYRRHLHMINVFQWPSKRTMIASAVQTRNGYHVVQWSESGLRFVAVSSVAEGDLRTFVRAFRAAPAASGEPAR